MDFNAIIERAKAILLKPKDTWSVIKEESTTVNEILMNYVIILAALPVVAGFLGRFIFGVGIPFYGRYRPGFFSGIVWAVVSYILAIVGVFVAAKVVELLAPTFQAKNDNVSAFKVVAYSMTASWVAGILMLIPDLSPLVMIIGFYGFYLLYLGLPYLMECPSEKALGYTIISIIVIIVVNVIIGIITAAIIGIPSGMANNF
jgi:hypothetical protein